MIIRYLGLWFLLALLAIGNGVLREATYGNSVSELAAHQISTFTGMVLAGLLVWRFSRIWRLESTSQALVIGFLWVVQTLSFEFAFGHYVAGHSWERLVQDYDVLQGRLWPVFLLWLFLLPTLFYGLEQRRSTSH